MKKILTGIVLLLLMGCEKEYNAYPNHTYTFSYLANKDQWGVETWGSHHFVTNEKIQDIEAFKECYVKYLCWNGLDKDCIVKKVYYSDRKKVKIQYLGKSPAVRTVIDINNCQ